MNRVCNVNPDVKSYMERFACILSDLCRRMMCQPLTCSISGHFICLMIAHRKAGIKMIENVMRFSPNRRLVVMGRGMRVAHTGGIDTLELICPTCRCHVNSECELCSYEEENRRIIERMCREMRCACQDGNIDATFIRQMIPFLRGAMQMAENALRFSLCPRLIPVLRGIISSHAESIRQLEQLLRRITCCRPPIALPPLNAC